MNGHHLKYMLLAGAGTLGVLLLVGVPLTSALLYAALLACPLMMSTMGGHGGRGGARRDHISRRSSEPGESIDGPGQYQYPL